MPEAPAPTPVLSRTSTSGSSPRARCSLARCQAVERPCTPAPMITYFAEAGRLILVSSVYCRCGNPIAISRHTIAQRSRERERVGAKQRDRRVLRADAEAGLRPLHAQDRDQLARLA